MQSDNLKQKIISVIEDKLYMNSFVCEFLMNEFPYDFDKFDISIPLNKSCTLFEIGKLFNKKIKLF